jgi:hypothetical protein
MGKVYHTIRSQSMVKLYVLTSIMEVFDKLLSSFGQDSLDSFFIQFDASTIPSKRKIFFHFIIVCLYVRILFNLILSYKISIFFIFY